MIAGIYGFTAGKWSAIIMHLRLGRKKPSDDSSSILSYFSKKSRLGTVKIKYILAIDEIQEEDAVPSSTRTSCQTISQPGSSMTETRLSSLVLMKINRDSCNKSSNKLMDSGKLKQLHSGFFHTVTSSKNGPSICFG